MKVAAGFYSEDEKTKDVGPWWPAAGIVRGDPRAAGLFLPAFLPGIDGPVAFRWRTFDRGARRKAMSMPGARCAVFGVALPPGRCWTVPADGARLVVVAEGEPDWWTLAAQLGPHAGVVALCAVSGGWPDALTPALDQAEAVVVATHDTESSRKVANELFLALAQRRGLEAARRAFFRFLVDEDADWNALHCAGEIEARLAKLRPLVDATMPETPEGAY